MPASVTNAATPLPGAVECLPFGVAITDAHGIVTWANAAFARLTGCASDELTGQSAGEFPFAELAHAAPSLQPWTKDEGTARHCVTALRDTAGEVTGFWITKEDSIHVERDGNARHDAEANLSALIESTQDLIWSVDLNYGLLTFNRALEQTFEHTHGVRLAVGMRPEDVLPAARAALWPPLYNRALSEGPFRTEYSLLDGRTLEIAFNPIVQHGETTGISVFGKDITERKKAERTLLETERKYRDIFEGAPEGIYRTSIDGKSLDANPAAARILGYDSAQEVVSTITDSANQVWVDPNERSHFLELLEHHGVVREYQCQHKRKDGTPIWVSLNSRKVSGEDGRTLYYEGFIQDITEHKRMESSLRKSEEKFAKAFQCVPAVVTLCDLTEDSRLVDVNEAFEQVCGYRREEAIGRNAVELGLWADPGEHEESAKQFRVAGRLRNFEHRFHRKNGDIGTGLTSSESIELDGKPLAISATIDITEQKKTEAAMRSLVTAIEQAGETIVITGIDGTIQYCNPAFEKITGYSKEEAIGQNPRVLKSGKHSPEFYEQLWTTITQGQVWTGHMINRKKDGALYEEEATISPIRDGSGGISGFVAVKRDVTERLQLERQFLQAQKLETVGRLAGGMAHDFNNLLTVINGYSDLLLQLLKAPDPLTAYAEEIRKAGERAARLTKQLLAFSRKQVIEPRVLDLNTTIRESTAMLRRLIGEDIALTAHLCASLGQVTADPDQIHQVIMNLVVNARDAMPEGGKLNIATANADLDEDGAAVHPDAIPGRYILMTVTDTGHGMDETTRQQIFEPFFTTKEVGKGTGLGLSTVYGIIRQSGGWIDVWSEVGVGTSFKVYLPRTDGSPLKEANSVGAPAAEGRETVLVVEDQEGVRSYTKAALKRCGYHVIEASDGEEALAVIKHHSGQIDLLLTDIVLPGMNGKELSKRLKELRPDLKVLFISGYPADVIAHRGKLDPGVAYIAKPFSPDALAAKVREVLATSGLV
jgi:two-component system cell cycle sensor histidine kinase/response regulator CckA